MGKVAADISMSLDGYVAGPNPTLEQPLGAGGEGLHEWAFGLASFRERHGESGGEAGPDDDVLRESFKNVGAVVMGRRMFSGGEGPWADDPNDDGWWGGEPPFRVPVFVLTHHERAPLEKHGGTTFTFVTDGAESALEQAKAAAGDTEVSIAGGAQTIQQYLRAGGIDELQIHVAPILLGGGVRLFDGPPPPGRLKLVRVVDSPAVTHVKYRVER